MQSAKSLKRYKRPSPLIAKALGLLAVIVCFQIVYLGAFAGSAALLVLVAILFGSVFVCALLALPGDSQGLNSAVRSGDRVVVLPIIILAIAAVKLTTRYDVYSEFLTSGMTAARLLVSLQSGRSASFSTYLNVLLTPLWVNLLVIEAARRASRPWLVRVAILVVPFLSFSDLVFLGARVTFAYQLCLLFLTGLLPLRLAIFAGLSFVAFFIYVHLSRDSSLTYLGFEYLRLTASGRTLDLINEPFLRDTPSIAISIFVFLQYISHSIGELVDLIEKRSVIDLNLVLILDQLAAVGFGNRQDTQAAILARNSGAGAYQTFFGFFLIDFGLFGLLLGAQFIVVLIILCWLKRGHVRETSKTLVAANFALAPIENFFILGGGWIIFILSGLFAVVLRQHVEDGSC